MNRILLHRITNAETKFGEWVRHFTIAIGITGAEVPTMPFYPCMIHGAEILLSPGTDFPRP